MLDERGPERMRDLWRNQPVEPIRMSADDLRRKAILFEARTRLIFRMAVVLLALLACGYGSFLYFFPSVVHRIGSSLTLVGFLYGAHQLYKRGPVRSVPAGPVSATGSAYRAELERQRDFYLSAWSRILAFVPGPLVFIMGFVAADQGVVKAAELVLALLVAPFAAGIPLNRRAARKLQREIDLVNTLQSQS